MKNVTTGHMEEIKEAILLQLSAASPSCLSFGILLHGARLFVPHCNIDDAKSILEGLVSSKSIISISEESDGMNKRYRLTGK